MKNNEINKNYLMWSKLFAKHPIFKKVKSAFTNKHLTASSA